MRVSQISEGEAGMLDTLVLREGVKKKQEARENSVRSIIGCSREHNVHWCTL